MRSDSTSALNRRARRARFRARRRTAVVASLAIGVIAAAGFTATAPTSQAQASSSIGTFELASFTTSVDPVPPVTVNGTDAISTEARKALKAATASVEAAAVIAADIEGAGLEIASDITSVDTAELESAVNRLEGSLDLPAPLVPDLTDDVTALVASVDGEVTGLREALEDAKQKKAEEEAAEKARLEAEAEAEAKAEAEAAAAAAASAAAPASPSSSSSGSAPAAPAPVPAGGASAMEAKAIARDILASYGWGDDQFACLDSLWHKESGWNSSAHNRSSGAYGIPQALPGSKMASAGADWQTNAGTQIRWGLGYIGGRYGTPCGAWNHSVSHNWY